MRRPRASAASPAWRALATGASAALALVAVACGRSDPAPSGAASGASAVPAATPERFWIRRAALLDAPGGQPQRAVEGPALVELLPGGRVRSVSGAAEGIDGYLPPTLLATPSAEEGLALYAQRAGDLHLDAPGGPVIGRLQPGAFVGVAPRGDGHLLVAMPGFRVSWSKESGPVLAFADRDLLGPTLAPLRPALPEGRRFRDYPNLPLWAQPYPSGTPFASTLCGDFWSVVEEAGTTRISQVHAGVELLGWLDSSVPQSRGPSRCTLRLAYRRGERLLVTGGTTEADAIEVPSVPDGFVHADLPVEDPMAALMSRGGSVHWVVETERGPVCDAWRFEGVRRRPPDEREGGPLLEGRLHRARVQASQGRRAFAWFRVRYHSVEGGRGRGEMELWGPYVTAYASGEGPPNGEPGGYRCVTSYRLVRAERDALRMLPPIARTSSPGEELVAWHPDDEEAWYLSREACEAQREVAIRAAAQGGAGASQAAGLHVDCYADIHRLGPDAPPGD